MKNIQPTDAAIRYFFVASNTRTLSVHKAIAICARKSTQDVLTLWNNKIGR